MEEEGEIVILALVEEGLEIVFEWFGEEGGLEEGDFCESPDSAGELAESDEVRDLV